MKNVAIAMLLVFGVSASSSVLACEGSKSHKAQTSTSAPSAPVPAPAK